MTVLLVAAMLLAPGAAVSSDDRPSFCKTSTAFNRAAPRRTRCTTETVADFCSSMSTACGVATSAELAALKAELAQLRAAVTSMAQGQGPLANKGCAKDLSGSTYFVRPRDKAGAYLATGVAPDGGVGLTAKGSVLTFPPLEQSVVGLAPGSTSAIIASSNGMQSVRAALLANFSAGGSTSGPVGTEVDEAAPRFEWTLEPNCADGSYLIAAAGPLPGGALPPGTRYLLTYEGDAVKWAKADGASPPAAAYWTLEVDKTFKTG